MNNFKNLTDNLITNLNPKECYAFVDSITFDIAYAKANIW